MILDKTESTLYSLYSIQDKTCSLLVSTREEAEILRQDLYEDQKDFCKIVKIITTRVVLDDNDFTREHRDEDGSLIRKNDIDRLDNTLESADKLSKQSEIMMTTIEETEKLHKSKWTTNKPDFPCLFVGKMKDMYFLCKIKKYYNCDTLYVESCHYQTKYGLDRLSVDEYFIIERYD